MGMHDWVGAVMLGIRDHGEGGKQNNWFRVL